MEYLLKDGDYVSDGNGGFQRAAGDGALLQRVLWKLSVRRGSFPFLPGLGSRLYLLPGEKPGARSAAARQYVSEALADEEDLTVEDVRLEEAGDGALRLTASLRYGGAALSAAVDIGG